MSEIQASNVISLKTARELIGSGSIDGKRLPLIAFMDAQQAEIERLTAAIATCQTYDYRQVIDGRGCEDEWPALADFLEQSESRLVRSSPVETLDDLIAGADQYILPVDVKIGAGTIRAGCKVGAVLRMLKGHAEAKTATAFSPETAP